MYKNILIATDGSELGHKAVTHGLSLANSVNAPVTFVTTTENWSATEMAARAARKIPHPIENYEKEQADWANKVLSEAAEEARKIGVICTTAHASDTHAADGIIRTAKDKACDLIVMSSHGRRGVGRLLLGSVATEVLTHTTIPVLICR